MPRPPVKIMLLGEMAVGKTSIANRLKFDRFDHDYKSTIGVSLHALEVDYEGAPAPVILWDTDGGFGDQIFESVYVKGASGALIVADVTRADTIDHMIALSAKFEDFMPGRPSLCLLNKSDLAKVSGDEFERIRKETDFLANCSAKTGDGVWPALSQLYSAIAARQDKL